MYTLSKIGFHVVTFTCENITLQAAKLYSTHHIDSRPRFIHNHEPDNVNSLLL